MLRHTRIRKRSAPPAPAKPASDPRPAKVRARWPDRRAAPGAGPDARPAAACAAKIRRNGKSVPATPDKSEEAASGPASVVKREPTSPQPVQPAPAQQSPPADQARQGAPTSTKKEPSKGDAAEVSTGAAPARANASPGVRRGSAARKRALALLGGRAEASLRTGSSGMARPARARAVALLDGMKRAEADPTARAPAPALPTALSSLLSLFRALDSACAMMLQRRQRLVFSALREPVQRIAGRCVARRARPLHPVPRRRA